MIRFLDFGNPTQESQARAAFGAVQFLLPAWVLEVNVYACPKQQDDDILTVHLLPDYRKIGIDVYPCFFARDLLQQRQDFQHEFFHAILGRMTDYVERALIKPIKDRNADLHAHIVGEWESLVESTVQELCYAHETRMREELKGA
jgi:hypothetical protein